MKYLLTLISCLFSYVLTAQSLYIPRDLKAAYARETRSMNGKPGRNYWQNRASYLISLSIDPRKRQLQGSEVIDYINNSPDTLRTIVLKLIPNIHRPGVIRYGNVSADYLNEGINITSFVANKKRLQWTETMGKTTLEELVLPTPLMPGDSLKLEMEWHSPISLKSNREGMIDSSTAFLAYFYPRLAVYDDYTDWDKSTFTDQEEFYNDFNDYKLSVSIPKDYVMWSTGTLMNPEEVLQPEYLSRYRRSLTSDSTVHIIAEADLKKGKITVQKDYNTWLWHATNVSDMAFGLSDHYHWDAASVIIEKESGKRASMQAAFDKESKDFRNSVQWGRYALSWYSQNWPGITYPYPSMTAFRGFADMEYPMIINDSSFPDQDVSRFVIDHEIVHSYFPFYMGINENRFAFMDEGWATAFELLIRRSEMSNDRAEEAFKKRRVENWSMQTSVSNDLPIITPTYELRGVSYRANSYGKPALAYLALKEMLGDELFRKCLHNYMSDWNGKHPTPWDFFNSFNSSSGINLDWFWNNWFFSNNYIDLEIVTEQKTKKGYTVKINNNGGFAVPFDISVTYTDGAKDSIHQKSSVWKLNQRQVAIDLLTDKTLKEIVIATGIYMDSKPVNNKLILR